MRITFVVPTTKITGGIRSVLAHAHNLTHFGHTVTVVHTFQSANRASWVTREGKAFLHGVRRLIGRDSVPWTICDASFLRVRAGTNTSIPQGDVVIATANETADVVNALAREKGIKVYFIQGYETWSRDPKEVRLTYHYPMVRITTSQRLAALLKEREGVSAYPTGNGVDTSFFAPAFLRPLSRTPRVLMALHPRPEKGSREGLVALRLTRERGIPFVATFMTAEPLGVDGAYAAALGEIHQSPSPHVVRYLYRTHDVFLHSPRSEGWGLMPMEAMACQCSVVTTDVGGVGEYATNEREALIVPSADAYALAQSLTRLLLDAELRARLSKEAYVRIQSFRWELVSRAFERILVDAWKSAHSLHDRIHV